MFIYTTICVPKVVIGLLEGTIRAIVSMICVTFLTVIYLIMGNNGIVYAGALSMLVAGGGYAVGMVRGARIGVQYGRAAKEEMKNDGNDNP